MALDAENIKGYTRSPSGLTMLIPSGCTREGSDWHKIIDGDSRWSGYKVILRLGNRKLSAMLGEGPIWT